jgi:hypothetical protein
LNSVQGTSDSKVGQRRVGGRFRLRLRRLRDLLFRPFGRMFRSSRTRRGRRSVDERRAWVRGSPLVGIVKIASVAGGVVLLVAVAWSLRVVIAGKPVSF